MSIQQYPSRLLERAVSEFAKLPGIGRKTALRLVLQQLRREPEAVHAFAQSLTDLIDDVKYCHVCHNISDTDTCDICANPQRDATTICVVENVQNVLAMEQTGQYHGLYHVLGGVISPMDGIGPQQLEIDSLIARVSKGQVKEIIFALNPTIEGDTTNFYITRRLTDFPNLRLTQLSRGVCVGDDLEYTDEVTLGRSLLDRVDLRQ
ncbi:MAG: recombination protein RecR [Bacteroidales bacterium]|nr:recombination protein RecR [Candidatus Equimonas enterica]